MLTGKEIFELNSIKCFLVFFGINIDPISEPERFRDALQQLDPRYKGGRDLVRFALEEDSTQWTNQQSDAIMAAAISLGILDNETPLLGEYDFVIALGGARQSNPDRLLYAIRAHLDGTAKIKKLIIACSTRKLNDAEKENVQNYAAGAETEEDLCYAAACGISLTFRELAIWVATSKNEKAGNPEVIEEAIKKFTSTSTPRDARICVVTTQIYKTAAELDLDRVARRYGFTNTGAAGNPSDPAIVAKRTPATYLSEVLRTLRAATLQAKEVTD